MSPPVGRRSGLAGQAEAASQSSSSDSTLEPATVNGWQALRERFVWELQQAGPAELVTPSELAAMRRHDPRFWPAVCRAVVMFAADRDPRFVERRLADELTAEAQVSEAAAVERFAEAADRVRRLADAPTFAQVRASWGES